MFCACVLCCNTKRLLFICLNRNTIKAPFVISVFKPRNCVSALGYNLAQNRRLDAKCAKPMHKCTGSPGLPNYAWRRKGLWNLEIII